MHNAAAENNTTETSSRDLVIHHLASFQSNDLNAVMSDYTDQSVFITENGTFTGTQEIRSFFTSLMKHFPTEGSNFMLDKMVIKNELVFIVWHGDTPTLLVPFGTDTFLISDNKITHQTFVGELNFLQ